MLKTYSQKKNKDFVAFFSTSKKKNKKKYKYRYFKLNPPKKRVQEAENKVLFYYWVDINPIDGSIENILAALVPYTDSELSKMREWSSYLKKRVSNSNKKGKQSVNSDCETAENNPPVYNPDTNTYEYGDVVVCANEDDEISDGNGGGDGSNPPDPDWCHDPETCQEDPNPTGGGNNSNPSNTCPTGEVKDKDDNCVKGEEPCEGNPVKKPRIAKQNGKSGIDGGRYGTTRYTGASATPDKKHNAIDIENPVGNAIFSPFDGNIDAVGYDKNLGYYVTVRFAKNGSYYLLRFAHLKKDSAPANGSTIKAGDVIGIQGTSGNLRKAIKNGLTKAHSHIEALKRDGNGWDHEKDYSNIDPETLLKTKFKEDGSVKPSTDC